MRPAHVLPLKEDIKPRLHYVRTCHAFTLLELAMETFAESPTKVLSYLEKDARAVKATQCLASALDSFAESHDSFLGSWGWNCIVSKLIPCASLRFDRAFVGRPGNPQERSHTAETEPALNTSARFDSAAPTKQKAPTRGMTVPFERQDISLIGAQFGRLARRRIAAATRPISTQWMPPLLCWRKRKRKMEWLSHRLENGRRWREMTMVPTRVENRVPAVRQICRRWTRTKTWSRSFKVGSVKV